MSKSKKTEQRVVNTLDPKSQTYLDEVRRRALGASKRFSPYDGEFVGETSPFFTEGMEGFRGAGAAGQLGLRALSGDQEALRQLMVSGEMLDPIFERAQARAFKGVDDRATLAGAYGSRADVARGVAAGEIANQRTMLDYQNIQDALARAGGLANLGFGANQAQVAGGQYAQGQDTLRRMSEYSEFLRQQGFGEREVDLLMRGLGPTSGTQISTSKESGGGILGTLGSLLQILPALTQFFGGGGAQKPGAPGGGGYIPERGEI